MQYQVFSWTQNNYQWRACGITLGTTEADFRQLDLQIYDIVYVDGNFYVNLGDGHSPLQTGDAYLGGTWDASTEAALQNLIPARALPT